MNPDQFEMVLFMAASVFGTVFSLALPVATLIFIVLVYVKLSHIEKRLEQLEKDDD